MKRVPSSAMLLLVAGIALGGPTARAADQAGASDVFKGFGSNKSDPIQIDADSLEVLDKDQNAVFSGNVRVQQKDTVMKTQRLRVFYEGNAAAGLGKTTAAPATPTAASKPTSQQIRRMEVEGKVLITQKDQSVTGDRGWFDIASNQARIDDNVVLIQGQNVARGKWLTIDLKTGQYTLGGRPVIVLSPQDPATSAKPGNR